ncbi:MAG: hypothetical protein JWQ57_1283 [Mucilaginibacter sp.]|nr:hypothetical protein [Mucilaginibacter sp.]
MVNLSINKPKALKVISIVTFIEIIASVAWPIKMTYKQILGLGALIIWAISAIPFIYYTIFIIFLARYSKREAEDQNIGLVIFFNLLPIVLGVYFFDLA